MMKSIVKKGKVKSTFIYLSLLFEEFHVRFLEKIFKV
jgi:hypothetical protein